MNRLLYINIAVFVVVRLADFFVTAGVAPYAGFLANWLSVPVNIADVGYRPWGILTYMITHYDFFHFVFNILCLYWFGKIFEYFNGSKSLPFVYLSGGFVGLIFTWVAYLFVNNAGGLMLGASASIMAIMLCVTVQYPNYNVLVPLVGEVRLKYYSAIIIAIDIISLPSFSNFGGHIAHLGGALCGVMFGLVFYKNGVPSKMPFDGLLESLKNWFARFSGKGRRSSFTVKLGGKSEWAQTGKTAEKATEEEIDRILDKIRASGYESLTKVEKQKLFNESQRK